MSDKRDKERETERERVEIGRERNNVRKRGGKMEVSMVYRPGGR